MGKIIRQRRDFGQLQYLYLVIMNFPRANVTYIICMLSYSKYPEKISPKDFCSKQFLLKNQRQRRDVKKDIICHCMHFNLKNLQLETVFLKTKQYILQTTLWTTESSSELFSEHVQIFGKIDLNRRQRRDRVQMDYFGHFISPLNHKSH